VFKDMGANDYNNFKIVIYINLSALPFTYIYQLIILDNYLSSDNIPINYKNS